MLEVYNFNEKYLKKNWWLSVSYVEKGTSKITYKT